MITKTELDQEVLSAMNYSFPSLFKYFNLFDEIELKKMLIS